MSAREKNPQRAYIKKELVGGVGLRSGGASGQTNSKQKKERNRVDKS